MERGGPPGAREEARRPPSARCLAERQQAHGQGRGRYRQVSQGGRLEKASEAEGHGVQVMDPEAGRRRNILIAALLRDSTTRRVVVLGGHDLHVPEYLFDEIEIHRDELAKRSGQTTDALEEALRILRGHVTEHEEADYVDELGKAGSLLGGRDPKDTPYVALALALQADGIWTEDRGLVSLGGLAVYRTSDIVRLALQSARRE